jgi:hypothetical protein
LRYQKQPTTEYWEKRPALKRCDRSVSIDQAKRKRFMNKQMLLFEIDLKGFIGKNCQWKGEKFYDSFLCEWPKCGEYKVCSTPNSSPCSGAWEPKDGYALAADKNLVPEKKFCFSECGYDK